MKRLLLFLLVFGSALTLTGCDELTNDPVDCEATPDHEECQVDCEATPEHTDCQVDCDESPNHEDCITDDMIEVLNFVGMDMSDVQTWASENKVRLTVSSEYRDDLLPNEVYYQSVEAGTFVKKWAEIVVGFSKGYNPEGEITVPDMTGYTEEQIREWLAVNDITNYFIYDTFSYDVEVGKYVSYQVDKWDTERATYIRKDVFKFYLSKGELQVEEVQWQEGVARGVNLGGWFVLEGWMHPDLYEGIPNAHDETRWIINNPNAEADLIEHWDTFITEEDFAWLAEHGVEYVRLPIPWWMFGVDAYQGTDLEVSYIDSSFYIGRAMEWAETYGINVLVDLHTAPGGQNGFDNGGLSGILEWPSDSNVNMTLSVLIEMMPFFNQYDSFWGFEVLNEPGWSVPLNTLQEYYVDAYNIIRAYNPHVWVGFHDGFRMYMKDEWTNFFEDNSFTNVFFDIHLYQVFGDGWSNMSIQEHLDWVYVEQRKAVQRYDGIVPVVVGEWSGGLPPAVYEGIDPEMHDDIKKAFLSAQLNEYEQGFGHFFWSYQILRTNYSEWDFVRMIEQGLMPDNWSDDEGTN